MAQIDFINELKALGYNPQLLPNGMVVFNYTIPVGKNMGIEIRIGFIVSKDFPMNCPSGPHFESAKANGWKEPSRNIHASPFGADWRYWSRPFPDWNRTQKTVKIYLAHIKNLLTSL